MRLDPIGRVCILTIVVLQEKTNVKAYIYFAHRHRIYVMGILKDRNAMIELKIDRFIMIELTIRFYEIIMKKKHGKNPLIVTVLGIWFELRIT